MSTTSTPPAPGTTKSPAASRPPGSSPRGPLRALIMRLHFYAGVFVAPFLIIAALSGALYALTPSLEEGIYSHELHVPKSETSVSLEQQILAAQAVVGDQAPSEVRPAPAPGDTTRIMFADPTLGESESRAIFINPANAEVRGDLTVYGTSGILPLRTWISELHRTLHLGTFGRYYSEMAASWLWVIALAGLALWLSKPKRGKKTEAVKSRKPQKGSRARLAALHGTGGVVLLVGLLFLSATGLTWSQLAGANISTLRTSMDWTTPKLATSLDPATAAAPAGDHDHHGSSASMAAGTDPAMFDHVLNTARQQEIINAGQIKINPPAAEGKAWTVTEIKRSWPTEVDAVAIDPTTMNVTGTLVFNDFNLGAKLTQWGISAHMGVLFGLANQLVLVAIALGLAASIVGGYLMWWKRRPTRGSTWALGRPPARSFLRTAPWPLTVIVIIVATAVGIALPLLGFSLVLFLIGDALTGALKRRRHLTGSATTSSR